MRSVFFLFLCISLTVPAAMAASDLEASFVTPPDSARPGVYWYFMDGNLSREGMTADLEAMADAGIGNLVFLEVNVGVPRGPVDFLSEPWQDLFVHAVREAERLGIEITLGVGPGWTGSGGPWVAPKDSMQHLVASAVEVAGPASFNDPLPVPEPRSPYFGGLPANLTEQRQAWYDDVTVLAFPTPKDNDRVSDIDEKALYYRSPFSSRPGVKPYLPAPADYPSADGIDRDSIIDVTDHLQADGRLDWDVPEGNWTIMRFAARNNGANTRPAPRPGLGFECDKFDASALDAHFAEYAGKLLEKVGERQPGAGWTMIHMDSWEMGAQNWTPRFRREFERRRGYDPQPFYPAYTGRIVGTLEETERFLWDLRLTGQELVIENHAEHLKDLGRRHGLGLSIEPYDMNPTSDLVLGAVADVQMCEFWSEGHGFDTAFSVMEASSLAHVLGHPIVAAEAFTAAGSERMRQFPGSMKNQGDWAFCFGINRFVYHTFAHQPLGDERPGMTMGPYGVHWHRNQSWWPMVEGYHRYVSRCSHLLRQSVAVEDILYLTPEGAPHVFRPPLSALTNTGVMPNHKGYSFDAVSPDLLADAASVRDGRIAFPGGSTYRLLVLPRFDTMTPALLDTITGLIADGATVVGNPPRKSPSLSGYPACDEAVRNKAKSLWGSLEPPKGLRARPHGNGSVFWGTDIEAPGEVRALLPDHGEWIWYPEGNPAQGAPANTVEFRYTFHIANRQEVVSADAEATADNEFVLRINGVKLSEGDSFHEVYRADILPVLRDGENVVTIEALNWEPDGNPAGLIALLNLRSENRTERVLTTGTDWQCRRKGDTEWKSARVLGPAGMGPWNLSHKPPEGGPYPPYDLMAQLLAEAGTPPDFESTGAVRYIHRRTEDSDLYFVANTTNTLIEADCTFRATSAAPELWNPLNGDTRRLPDFAVKDGRTTIPVRFEAYQSFFVMFPRETGTQRSPESTRNFPEYVQRAVLEGPWTVQFDEDWGYQGPMVFETLQDWSQCPENEVRFYSGIATYEKRFQLPGAPSGGRLHLDLGAVHDIARVRLNGEDLGVLWTAPWRVDITEAVKEGENLLEIDVANRWANRLIGDAQAPPEEARQLQWDKGLLGGTEHAAGPNTFITHTYYNADSELLPSGLLGPVQILTEE